VHSVEFFVGFVAALQLGIACLSLAFRFATIVKWVEVPIKSKRFATVEAKSLWSWSFFLHGR
jgi:hypothetical protein